MYKEEITIENKYTNWNVWKNGKKKNVITFVPMTTEQALNHFKADAVRGLDEEHMDEFGSYANEVEGKIL